MKPHFIVCITGQKIGDKLSLSQLAYTNKHLLRPHSYLFITIDGYILICTKLYKV